jgi:hypothetical protein
VPDTIKLKAPTTLKHQPNLGEEAEEIQFEAGQPFAVLKEWETSYLAKDDDGKLFNVKKELAEES